MASVVCQGLQACIEPLLIETTILTHKSSSKPTQVPQKPTLEVNSNNGESVSKKKGWTTFLSVLEKPSSNHVKNEEVYVHPMVKRSASALSSMSLEMCTESLGAETGSDVSESSDEFTLEEREKYRSLMRSKARAFLDRKMVSQRKGGGGFPPPLTSISGSDGTVKVKPHREGGRLVIKAVSISDCGTKFEAERANGRLKLSLSKDCFVKSETGGAKMKNVGIKKECCDSDAEEGGRGGRWCEMNENIRKVGGKTGLKIRSLKRPSRLPSSFDHDSTEFGLTKCKDGRNGNKGIGNWSLFRVVIS
ncbi:the fantastic four family [Artemisia annua]|uniref:The fantastic four family n=1 Tax=Artemisia annua TaxID=35608 RepID=A0A2U1M2I6_ARTAN|nr:the fantastic four family [Artemisia annua]